METPQYVVGVSANKPRVLSLVPTDPGSRYKCRQLQVQVHGHSKMIKTILVNILDVAKDFQVPPPYVGTYMGYEIGAMSKFDTKKPERQQASISGEHEIKDLSKLVLKFIQEVVLCPVCGLPEVQLRCGKQVMGECRACGGNTEMRITNDKFRRYVINHPPERTGDAFNNKTGVAKNVEKVRNTDKPKKEKSSSSSKKEAADEGEEEEVVWYTDASSEAAKARKLANVPDAISQENTSNTAGNTSPTSRVLDKAELLANINANDFAKIDQQKSDAGLNGEQLIKAIIEVISADLETLGKKHKSLLNRYASNEATQCALLNAIEENCAKSYPALMPKAPILIKSLYDEEILVEETILLWSTSKHANLSAQFRQSAQPLIKWLQEAEEEDSDEEEEEGEGDAEEDDAQAMLDAL